MEQINLTEFEGVFREVFVKNGLERFCLSDVIQKFARFTELLLEANERFNLTAIKAIPDVIAKHYADCLLAESCFPNGATVLDVGCGGGFPAFPLAITRPDLHITAVDSTQKKIDFVSSVAKEMGLTNINAICARAESPEMRRHREKFDIVTSRAMARMEILSELTLPFAKPGGKIVALKGAQGVEELEAARNGICLLGGSDVELCDSSLWTPAGAEARCLVVVPKKRVTPAQYPRPYARILKKPL